MRYSFGMDEVALQILNGIVLGDGEHYGYIDSDGNFNEAEPSPGYRTPLQIIRDDMAIPIGASAEILNPQGDVIADLQISATDGRVMCSGIKARNGHELTSENLRGIPIAKLVARAAQAHIVFLRGNFAVRFPANGLAFSPKGEIIGRPRRVLDEKFLKEVARIYRTALATGKAPAIAVEETLGPTTPENARRWIATARREGFLGPSPGAGRKGEAIPHSRPAER